MARSGTVHRHRLADLVGVALAGGVLAAAVASPLAAQQPMPRGTPQVRAPRVAADPVRHCDPQRTLGVSRVIAIDPTAGPRFGHQQYKEIELLQDGEIILTFDDGPLRAHTQAVVNALEAQCTRATFFMVGSQAIADPDMVKRIMRAGHTVGNHTWSHADLRKLTPLRARQEIELGFSAVTLAAGKPIAPFFRFPFLSDTRAMKALAETRGFGIFSIEVDALDYRNKENPPAVHAEVLRQLAAARKGIILFHDIQPSTAAALPGLLAALKAKGYRIVHLQPTTSMATLPEFDAMAQREAATKRVAAASSPLARRAVTYPLPSRASLPVPYAPPPVQLPPPAPPPQLRPLPPPRVSRPPPPPDDWRRSVFGN